MIERGIGVTAEKTGCDINVRMGMYGQLGGQVIGDIERRGGRVRGRGDEDEWGK